MEFPQFVTIPATGDKMPIIGFGSGTKWQKKKKGENGGPEKSKGVVDPDLVRTLELAVKHGFIHLDTAEVYTTRRDVGVALKELNIPREKLWITDKYHWGSVNDPVTGDPRGPYESLKEGLQLMGIKYVDLFLIHTVHFTDTFTIEEQWRQMEQLKDEGLARNIGVSNYDPENIDKILAVAKYKPGVCQIEFCPYMQNQTFGIQDYLKKHDILLESYGPCEPLSKAPDGPLKELLPKLAKKYGRSETQILLKWTHQQGYPTVTTTSKESRMDDILQVFDLHLDDEDMKAITDVGNSYWFRAFSMYPVAEYDEALKKQRGLI